MPISVQKKEESEARALYQQILEAMVAEKPQIIELTCDKQEDKKIAVIGNQINSVVLSEKSGTAAAGKTPGFFSTISEDK